MELWARSFLAYDKDSCSIHIDPVDNAGAHDAVDTGKAAPGNDASGRSQRVPS